VEDEIEEMDVEDEIEEVEDNILEDGFEIDDDCEADCEV